MDRFLIVKMIFNNNNKIALLSKLLGGFEGDFFLKFKECTIPVVQNLSYNMKTRETILSQY